MMKFWIIIIVCASTKLIAQDKLIFKNGGEVPSIIIEVNADVIKYKRFDNPNGPVYSIPRNEIDRIFYKDGQVDSFIDQSKVNTKSPLENKLRYGGPRIGITYLQPGESTDKMNDIFDRDINPLITQFGWQFETRFFTLENGASGLVELIPMFGGLEQGLFIPSITGLVGYRSAKGYEIGIGPTLSLGGSGVLIAAGTSIKSGQVVFPINIAFIPSVTKSYQEEKTENQIYNPLNGLYETQTLITPAHKEHTGFRVTLTLGFNSRSK
jgi:hypothetical protein